MNTVDTRRFEMLVRVREFGTIHADLFPASTLGGKAFAALTSAVADLTQHVSAQLSGIGSAREATTSKAVAREALRDDLDAIVRTVRVMALDDPGVAEKFTLPRSSGDHALLSTARQFASDAKPLAKEFIEHYMPKDFVTDLIEDISEFEQAMSDREAGRDIHTTAGAAIEGTMDAALDAVRRLDGLVPNRLRDDPTTLAAWDRARRVEYRARKKAEAPEASRSCASATSSPA